MYLCLKTNNPMCVFNSFRRKKMKIYLFSLTSFLRITPVSVHSYCYHSNFSHPHCSAGLLPQPASCSSCSQAWPILICFITLKSEWTFYKAILFLHPPWHPSNFLFLLTYKALNHLALISYRRICTRMLPMTEPWSSNLSAWVLGLRKNSESRQTKSLFRKSQR